MSLISAEQRRRFVGASEISAVVGVSPWRSRWDVWREKSGLADPVDLSGKLPVALGVVLESFVARWWARESGLEDAVTKVDRYCAHPEEPGMGASLDFVVRRNGVESVLEVKTVGERAHDSWPAGSVPTHYLVQVQQQMACSGLSSGIVVALVGNREIVATEVSRHEKTIERIRDEIRSFWQEVEDKKAPDPNWKLDSRQIAAAWRETDIAPLVRPDLEPALEEYVSLGKAAREASTARSELRAKILHAAEGHSLIEAGDLCATISKSKDALVKEHTRYGSTRLTVRSIGSDRARAS